MNGKIVAMAGFLSSLLGCGWGSIPQPPASRLLVLGNSITYHSPTPSLGWNGSWGMAASSEQHDFAHLTASTLHIPLTRLNVVSLETTPSTASEVIKQVSEGVDDTTAVILELGDNVPRNAEGLAGFQSTLRQLIDSVRPRRSLTCTSTFWHHESVDDVIKRECVRGSGQFVYIGDIRQESGNTDSRNNTFTDPTVAGHPQNWGMGEISRRLVTKMTTPPY
jgi:hypothetical protein